MGITTLTSEVTSNLFVATTVKFGEDILKRVSGLTFLYDPNWSISQNQFNGTSLPFAFFETLSHELQQSNEVSESRVILYDPSSESIYEKDGSFKPSVLQVVADNVTTKPLVHRISCLVPFGCISKRFSDTLNIMEVAIEAFNGSQKNSNGGTNNSILEYVRQMMSTVQLANAAISGVSDIVSAFSSYNNAMYNRNSILAMQRNRNLVQFKTWEGWELKYGIIKNFVVTKVGAEDDYLRGTFELEELPILFIGDTSKLTPTVKTASAVVKRVQSGFQSFYKSMV